MSVIAASTDVMSWELSWARPLLLIHAAIGFGTLAISVHVLWFARKSAGGGSAWRARRYVGIAWPMYLASFISGALIYPAYMVTVRKAWLEANRPAMVGWFEIKEHWAALGLILAWGMWRYYRKSERGDILTPNRTAQRGMAVIALLATICVLINALFGTWIVMIRSV